MATLFLNHLKSTFGISTLQFLTYCLTYQYISDKLTSANISAQPIY